MVLVTPQQVLVPRTPGIDTLYFISNTLIAVRIFDSTGASVQQDFSIVVFKP